MNKPQYGAFAAPIAMLLVLYLETLVLYLAACLDSWDRGRDRGPPQGGRDAQAGSRLSRSSRGSPRADP